MKKNAEKTNYMSKGGNSINQEIVEVIGTELKRRRRSQSRTLDSFDCKCSISYISKIENGKIKPNYNVLRELCYEQGITQAELDSLMEVDKLISDVYNALFYNQTINIDKIYQQLESFNNYKVNLLKALCYVYRNDYHEVELILPTLDIISDRLSLKDYTLYLFLQMQNDFAKERYFQAHTHYTYVQSCDDAVINGLCFEVYFKSICMCGFENPVHYYENLLHIYRILYKSDLQSVNQYYYQALVNLDIKLPKMILGNFNARNKIIYYIKQNMFKELLDIEKSTLSEYDKLLVAMACNEHKNAYESYTKLDMTELNKKEIIIANYSRLIIDGNQTGITEYIVNKIIPFAYERGDFKMLYYFVNALTCNSSSHSRYKNVVQYCNMIINYINDYQKCIRF